jgi:hypothetical protein
MPTLRTVHLHWMTDRRNFAEACGQADAGEPSCYACGWWMGLERAHLIDRVFGGLDLACNLVPLCHDCHREMPSFRPGEESEALAWVRHHRSHLDAMMPKIHDYIGHIERLGGAPDWMARRSPEVSVSLARAAANYLDDQLYRHNNEKEAASG